MSRSAFVHVCREVQLPSVTVFHGDSAEMHRRSGKWAGLRCGAGFTVPMLMS